MDGLSALANVGYSAADLEDLARLRLETNRYGLFVEIENASKFVKFASAKVPEHAPFIPVKILARIPPVHQKSQQRIKLYIT